MQTADGVPGGTAWAGPLLTPTNLAPNLMPLFLILLVAFPPIPLVEIYLLIKVGSIIGAFPTVFLVVFTAVLGAALLRHQGLATLRQAQETMARGQLPAVAVLEGVILLVSGALLLTPGFFTDTLGFLGLIPPLRRALALKLLERGLVVGVGPRPGAGRPEPGQHTIDGECRREDD